MQPDQNEVLTLATLVTPSGYAKGNSKASAPKIISRLIPVVPPSGDLHTNEGSTLAYMQVAPPGGDPLRIVNAGDTDPHLSS